MLEATFANGFRSGDCVRLIWLHGFTQILRVAFGWEGFPPALYRLEVDEVFGQPDHKFVTGFDFSERNQGGFVADPSL